MLFFSSIVHDEPDEPDTSGLVSRSVQTEFTGWNKTAVQGGPETNTNRDSRGGDQLSTELGGLSPAQTGTPLISEAKRN